MFNSSVVNIDDNIIIEWLLYKNIDDWIDMVKKRFICIGMAIDKPRIISKSKLIYHVLRNYVLSLYTQTKYVITCVPI